MALLVLAGVARAEVEPALKARLVGRVYEQGSINAIPHARILSPAGSTEADDEGRFQLALEAGEIEVVIVDDAHEPLHVKERLVAGQGLAVEYRLTPLQHARYRSTVKGAERREGERFTLREEELHQAPGTLGDPFRVIALLPGVAQPLPLLPYYVVRGASPGENGFFLDGMRVPQLFHFLVGGGVVHGRLVDRLDFYPGTYDVQFGRYVGGIIDAETRPAREGGYHGEIELRLYDVSAYVEAQLPRGVKLEVAGHYGYPSFIIHAIDDRVSLDYGDYQLRLDWKGLTVEALGSYDGLTIAMDETTNGVLTRVPSDLKLQFHRLQVRDRERFGRHALEVALVGGYDEMITFGSTGVHKWSLAWRAYLESKWKWFRLNVGTDGELSRFTAQNFGDASAPAAPDQFGDLAGNRDGVVAGAYAEGTAELLDKRLKLTAGVRADVYHAGPVTLLGIDPRFLAGLQLLPWLRVTAGIGLYQQPPSFPVALPGIDTFALQLGLQRAWQGSAGVEAKLPLDFSLKLTGYYSRFYNVNDPVVDFAPAVCTSPPPESLSGLPAQITRQIDGDAYGMELLLRRSAGRVTGWIAYTLSRSERIYSCGLRPSDFDQAHILNVVVQARLPWKLLAGARLYVATGRPVTILQLDGTTTVRNNTRLPDYVQLDLRIDREWLFRKWALAAFIEVVNATYSQSNFGIQYPVVDGVRRYDMPSLNGFHWILPSLGLRGRF